MGALMRAERCQGWFGSVGNGLGWVVKKKGIPLLFALVVDHGWD